jgi:hypothetical protein
MTRHSLRWPVVIIVLLLLVRLLAVFHHEFDSDEGQHLHMVYGWAHGELPYRDRFDNHTPLLYLLYLPLASLAGETPQIVLLARLAIFPLSALMLLLCYAIARRLSDRETALWAVAITLALADWSLKSLEFRPDVLWACLWFVAVWLLIRRADRPTALAFFGVGLALGAALCSSIKTTFLVPALGVGWSFAWVFSASFRALYPPKKIAVLTLAAAVGFAVFPAFIFGGFLAAGTSLETLKFCLFDANKAPFEVARILLCLALAPVMLFVAWRMLRRDAVAAALFLATTSFVLALIGFSPELRKQTFLPVYPLLIFFGCRYGFARLREWRPAFVPIAGTIAVAVAFAHLTIEGRLWRDGLEAQREVLRDTLALTKPGDTLLDLKGETIFRKRPVFLVYQHATVRGIEEGRLKEPDPALLANTAVVVGGSGGFTDVMREYLKQHYLAAGAGNLRVAGKVLKPSWQNGRWIERIDVPVAGDYIFWREGKMLGEVTVAKPGVQTFDFASDRGQRVLFWKPAWEAGYAPR